MGRLPDGRVQVTAGGRDFALPPSQAAQVAQATQSSLAGPRATDPASASRPPIWEGRARYGHAAQVLSRNPDGTFQVTVDGVERTMTEPNVAFMTGLKKGPLYEMLGKATDGWMRGEGQSPNKDSNIDAAPEDGGSLSADDWFKHIPPRGSFGGELFDVSQLDAIEKELAEHGVQLVRDADKFLAEGRIAGGFQAIGPNSAKFYLKEHPTLREVLHEMIHFRQFRDLGYDEYMKLRKTGKHETQVWEWFEANPQDMTRLNIAEQEAEFENYRRWNNIQQ